jgi:predicted nucleic acid-binding protein
VTIVVDSSVVVAALIDEGPMGAWARAGFAAEFLAAPTHLLVEASNVLRRVSLTGGLGSEVAALAHRDLVDLPVQLFPFEPLVGRVWELRAAVTSYDAAYVALAEELDAPLWTLDQRLIRAPGTHCVFRTPETTTGR